MKQQIITTGIVLVRRDFQEADRIITVLTPDQGKLSMIAKGVRRPGSKLAGGIELFSTSNLTILPGKGELMTLISSRLLTHYGNIVKEIERTMLGYELLKRMNRLVEDAAGVEYYEILKSALAGLDDLELPTSLTELWFSMQLLKVTGHTPNLKTDILGDRLEAGETYLFDFDDTAFKKEVGGPFTASHIKLLRLGYGTEEPGVLKQVQGAADSADEALQLANTILQLHVRI